MLERVLEPEVMDSADEARQYDQMDHAAVNRAFVDDFLAALRSSSSATAAASAYRAAPPSQSMKILDLGTGTAQIPIALCQRVATCRVVAIDAADSMLALARTNVAAAQLAGRIELARVDAKRLPYPDAAFAAVMLNSIVHHIAEPQAVLAEALRVTQPGGVIFVRDLLRPGTRAELSRLVDLHAAGATPAQRALLADSLAAALSLDEMQALVADLGHSPGAVRQTSDRHWTWATIRV